MMLPSISPSSPTTSSSAPTAILAPISAAAAHTGPRGVHSQQPSASVSPSSLGVAGFAHSPAATPGLGAGLSPTDLSHPKRGPSQSLDAQSPSSSGSLTSNRDNASAVLRDQRTKRRRTGVGSRGVASLTPEQLAKKRANDREAQRAIRERTKNQIEDLESQIRNLTEQQPYQELQKVIRQKEAVVTKNAQLKAALASIVAAIQPLLADDLAESEEIFDSPVLTCNSIQPPQEQQQQQQLSSYSAHNGSTTGSEYTPHSGVDFAWPSSALSQPTSPPHSGYHQAKELNQQQHDRVPNLNIASRHHKLAFLLDTSHNLEEMEASVNQTQYLPTYQHLPLKHDAGTSTHADNNHTAVASSTSLSLPPPTQQHQYIEAPFHSQNPPQTLYVGVSIPIKHVPPTCVIDSILLNFMHERRQRIAEGMLIHEVMGPNYPSVSSMLRPEKGVHLHPVSKFFADILSKFSALCGIPERVAILFVMFRVMRWHISPTPENYEMLPGFSKPLDVQFSKPHPAWVDYLPFVEMRRKFVVEYSLPGFNFEEMFIPYSQTLSLSWPYEEGDAILEPADGGEIMINPAFLTHLLRIENWTLGDAFDQACPALRGTYNLRSDSKANPSSQGAAYQVFDRHQARVIIERSGSV
ncbi:hypothetical protein F4802DRAFT_577527 [Xylaria palmicola]|nr:hypothetical protein F4802DRAFT_577527 [Xylaria palmicola]